MNLRQYTPADIKGRRVILRCDLDVDIKPGRQDLRLQRSCLTIRQLLDFGAGQIVIIGHRGRPALDWVLKPNLTLAPVKDALELLLAQTGSQERIILVEDIKEKSENYQSQKLLMLENLRFWPEEQARDTAFASALSKWGDVYINEAFAVCHRRDASVTVLPEKMKFSFAGPQLANEVRELENFSQAPARPFLAILGGAKIATKLPLLKLLPEQADVILVGGGLANTIWASRGIDVGISLYEKELIEQARELDAEKIILPADVITIASASQNQSVKIDELAPASFIGDIGPETLADWQEKIKAAAKILWNGPVGKFEETIFSQGTINIAQSLAASPARTLVGGGDTVEAIEQLNLVEKFGFVSVGGGAMLTFLSGGEMPGLEALRISNF